MRRCCIVLLFLLVFEMILASRASAQATAYRQTNLTSSFLGQNANQLSPSLINPWSVAFLPGGDFFIAENGIGLMSAYDVTGAFTHSVIYPLPQGSTAAHSNPTAIVADPNENFGPVGARFQFIAASEDGTISAFRVADGVPGIATLVVNGSAAGAVYTGMTIISPNCCNPKLAVANFHSGEIEVRDTSRVALPGSFTDPNLPVGYGPWNVQTIGGQVFVTYARQDAARKDPVVGAGNGIVSIFDQDGNFIRRFVSEGGPLNVPSGIVRATANFGPFSNDILIGNLGDGTIDAFDPATGSFLGQLKDGEGQVLTIPSLRGLAFRTPDGIGSPNSLYFVAGPRDGLDGLFGFIAVGATTRTTVEPVDDVLLGDAGLVIATVTSEAGTPSGTVSFFDGDNLLLTDRLGVGIAAFVFISDGNDAGNHVITARYEGDANFLPSHDSRTLRVVTGAIASLSNGSILFGDQLFGSSSAVRNLTITNTGGAPLNVAAVQVTGDFFVVNNSCATPIPVSGVCTISVSFRPTALGSRSGILTISDNSSSSPHLVQLNGTGRDIVITLSRPSRPRVVSVSPASARQDLGPLALTVEGSGFENGAVVYWNGSPRHTAFISNTQLTASITTADLAAAGTASIAVTNPAPDGGSSGTLSFAIDSATTSVTASTPDLSIVAGQSRAIAVQATGFAGTISATCLNAPAGVSCSYDQTGGAVDVRTSVLTAKGTYNVTVLLNAEYVARGHSSFSVLWLSFASLAVGSLLATSGQRARRRRGTRLMLPLVVFLSLLLIGCGGSSASSSRQPAQSAVQASTALRLTIK